MKCYPRRPVFFLRRHIRIKDLSEQMNSKTELPTDSAVERRESQSCLQDAIEPIAFGTSGELFNEIRDFFALHPGLTTESIHKLTYFMFALQFPESWDIWPLVSVVAPDTVGSSFLLRMLGCVCIAPLQLGEVTLNALLTLPQAPRPSLLLIDQLIPNKELERVLRILSRPGSRILRRGKFHDISIPTLVCTAEPLTDHWILEQAIHIVMRPTRCGWLKLGQEELNNSARTLRGKLFHYRETNFAKISASNFDAPQLSSPTREIANALGKCIVDDDSLRRTLPMLLEAQDQHARTRRTDSIEAVVAEAAMFLSHEVDRVQARVGEVADIANGILKGRGESLQLDPRAVGNHLRALGLFSERLGRAGRGILFTKEVRRTIHDLAHAYDVRSAQENARCEFCAEGKSRNEEPLGIVR
jgi:hypothetical protein